MTNIGKSIKQARTSKGLTQTQLGELLGTGYDKSQISNIENGRIIVGVKLLNRIAKVLNTEILITFDGED